MRKCLGDFSGWMVPIQWTRDSAEATGHYLMNACVAGGVFARSRGEDLSMTTTSMAGYWSVLLASHNSSTTWNFSLWFWRCLCPTRYRFIMAFPPRFYLLYLRHPDAVISHRGCHLMDGYSFPGCMWVLGGVPCYVKGTQFGVGQHCFNEKQFGSLVLCPQKLSGDFRTGLSSSFGACDVYGAKWWQFCRIAGSK